MFYYDKMGLLTPEFVAKNGYRYYAMPQYLTLEIILFLRKLDISVPHIKEFLEHRSRDKILGILKERESLCKQTLSETQQLLAAISCYRKHWNPVSTWNSIECSCNVIRTAACI